MGMQPLLSTAASTYLQAYLWLQLPTSNLPDKSDVLAIAAGVEVAAFRQVREERAELVLFIMLIPISHPEGDRKFGGHVRRKRKQQQKRSNSESKPKPNAKAHANAMTESNAKKHNQKQHHS